MDNTKEKFVKLLVKYNESDGKEINAMLDFISHLTDSKIEECAVTAENEKVSDIQNDGDWHYNNGCDAGANAIRKRYFILVDSDE